MTTLVTGASGFVGSAVLRRLLDGSQEVRVLVRPTSDRRNLAGLAVEVATGDLTDPVSLRKALSGCHALFHVAADYRLWIPEPAAMYAANVDGTVALMEAALDAGVERVVYTSSVATLGLNPDRAPADEETPVALEQMIGHYKRSKFLAERAVLEMVHRQGLPAVVVNPSTPVGPRDIKPTPTGRMIRDAARGKMPAYVDTGLNIAHVDDVAEGHWQAFERGRIGERYILGGENLSLKEIFSRMAALSGHPPPRVRIPHHLLYPVAYAAEGWVRLRGRGCPLVTVDEVRMARKWMFFSSEKARRELDYRPRPAQEALGDALHWFRENHYLQ
ncbi:MAG: hopanoid-associated sugar epimerase [Gammaproteobacteria bacterium]|nr:NAD-dependent epimerase/dehydratase family protein [Gammaproteobacteria bacterium]